MSHRRESIVPRRAAGALVAVWAILAVLAATAGAQAPKPDNGVDGLYLYPATPTKGSNPIGRSDALDPQAIAFYTRTYGVDDATARERLRRQTQVLGLAEKLHRRLGDDYAGSWFDNDAGNWVVAIGPRADAGEARAVLAELGVDPVDVVRRSHSYRALVKRYEGVSRRLAARMRAGHASAGIGAKGLEVTVAAGTPASRRAAIAAEASAPAAGEDPAVPIAVGESDEPLAGAPGQCQFPYCDQLVGGIRYWRDNAGGCTAAFYSGSPVDGRPFMLTAGHCVAGGRRWYTCHRGQVNCWWAGVDIGGYYGGGGGDGGVMRRDHDWWGITSGWVNWWNLGITRPTHTAPPAVGHTLCHQGGTTQSSCGTVTNYPWSNTYNDGTSFTGVARVAGACQDAGDSGGPWSYANWAYAAGIHSGGAIPRGCNTWSQVEPIDRAMRTLNVFVYG